MDSGFVTLVLPCQARRHVAPQRRPWVILREVLIAFLLLLAFMFVVQLAKAS